MLFEKSISSRFPLLFLDNRNAGGREGLPTYTANGPELIKKKKKLSMHIMEEPVAFIVLPKAKQNECSGIRS